MTAVSFPLRGSEHPRLRARRAAVEEETRVRRWRYSAQLGALCVFALLGALVLHSPLFDLEALEVDGWTGDPAVLARASGLQAGEPLIHVDLEAARTRLAAIPQVEAVHLERRWNGVVTATITERTPVAALRVDDGRPLLIDEAGRILGRGEAGPGVLEVSGVVLTGDTSARVRWLDPRGTAAATVASSVPADVAVLAERVRVDGSGYLLMLHNGAVVRLGGADDLQPKFTALRTLLTHGALHCASIVSVQAPVSPVIDRDENCV